VAAIIAPTPTYSTHTHLQHPHPPTLTIICANLHSAGQQMAAGLPIGRQAENGQAGTMAQPPNAGFMKIMPIWRPYGVESISGVASQVVIRSSAPEWCQSP